MCSYKLAEKLYYAIQHNNVFIVVLLYCILFYSTCASPSSERNKRQLIEASSQSIDMQCVKNGSSDLSMMTGSDGVSLRLPQLFLSQQRLQQHTETFHALQPYTVLQGIVDFSYQGLFALFGSAPDPAGGAHSAPPDLLAGFEGSYF